MQQENQYAIEAQHLSKSFDDKVILNDISFKLKQNNNYVILGRSGSGKSVLLKCVVGLLNYDAGDLKVLGHDIGDMEDQDMNALRRRVGYLFQGGALYDAMTVKENLEFPLERVPDPPNKNEIKDKVEEALDNVGLLEVIDKMPSELSGGMKKRVALARTLILHPDIMLYDEPTTGLDVATSREISELMIEMQYKYGISSLTVTHDLSCASLTGNKIFVLDKGNFIAEGKIEDLMDSDNGQVSAFFNRETITS